MSDGLRAYCGRVAASVDDVFLALLATEPRRPSRRREVPADVVGSAEVGAWLSRLGGDLRHLGALPAEDPSDDD